MANRLSVVSEFDGAQLGDKRLNKRLTKVVSNLERQPESAFPKAMVTPADTEGFYRFVRNPKIVWEALLQPHLDATVERANEFDEVLVLHDSTEFSFGGSKKRQGLGKLQQTQQGFLGHFSIVVSADGSEEPLGVASVVPVVRQQETATGKIKRQELSRAATLTMERESAKWIQGITKSSELLQWTRAIHVGDREADIYALLCQLASKQGRYVIRNRVDRILDEENEHYKLRALLARCANTCKRDVRISAHGKQPGNRKSAQARESRNATLAFKAAIVMLARPTVEDKSLPKTLRVNVVQATEIDAPEGVAPVNWVLFTTEPIDTPEHVLRVVDIYRSRWLIEEYFMALKSGCAYQKRQLESKPRLLNALAILAPIAWALLRLRHLSRQKPDAPAAAVITHRQTKILRRMPATKEMKLDTVRDALLAVARLGGHLKHNGDPGWRAITDGFHELLKAELGYRLAELDLLKCD